MNIGIDELDCYRFLWNGKWMSVDELYTQDGISVLVDGLASALETGDEKLIKYFSDKLDKIVYPLPKRVVSSPNCWWVIYLERGEWHRSMSNISKQVAINHAKFLNQMYNGREYMAIHRERANEFLIW